MSDENTGMEPKASEPDAAFAVDGVGNWDVHSNDVCSAQPNENCSVHSTAYDWDAHYNGAIDIAGGKSPTHETYGQFQTAYDYLNSELFENKLPRCLITLQRQRSSYGYFSANRFGRKDGERTDEIALNPQHLQSRSTEQTLSTLAHEMVHLSQHQRKTAGRPGYHNKEWADQMEAIGLIPSSTGKEGGKRTGDSVSHYIQDRGRFALAVEKLLATGFEITWREVASDRASSGAGGGGDQSSASLSGKRTKFICPVDGCQNAWAKPSASLMCAIHQKQMLPAD